MSLGKMTFGEQTSEKEAFKIMDFAYENGINFFDTAEMYPIYPKQKTSGKSEEIIGKWVKDKKNRDKILRSKELFVGLRRLYGYDLYFPLL